MYKGLLDPAHDEHEGEGRKRIQSARSMAKPEWNAITAARGTRSPKRKESRDARPNWIFQKSNSDCATWPRPSSQYVAEMKKPDGERLPGYHDAQLESLRFQLFSPAPIYPDMEIARMAGALATGSSGTGPDDPFVKDVLERQNPCRTAATAW